MEVTDWNCFNTYLNLDNTATQCRIFVKLLHFAEIALSTTESLPLLQQVPNPQLPQRRASFSSLPDLHATSILIPQHLHLQSQASSAGLQDVPLPHEASSSSHDMPLQNQTTQLLQTPTTPVMQDQPSRHSSAQSFPITPHLPQHATNSQLSKGPMSAVQPSSSIVRNRPISGRMFLTASRK
jgi:hypothetical protein